MLPWQLDFWHGSAAVEIADPHLLDNPVVMAPMLSDPHEAMPAVMFAPAMIAPVMPAVQRPFSPIRAPRLVTGSIWSNITVARLDPGTDVLRSS